MVGGYIRTAVRSIVTSACIPQVPDTKSNIYQCVKNVPRPYTYTMRTSSIKARITLAVSLGILVLASANIARQVLTAQQQMAETTAARFEEAALSFDALLTQNLESLALAVETLLLDQAAVAAFAARNREALAARHARCLPRF